MPDLPSTPNTAEGLPPSISSEGLDALCIGAFLHLISAPEITLIRKNSKLMKRISIAIISTAMLAAPAFAAKAPTYKHPLDPLNMKSSVSLHYSDGSARGDLGIRVSNNIVARAHATDEGDLTFGGGMVMKLTERDEWGTGLLRTGISIGGERTDFDEIGSKTSVDASFVVSEYLNREREILLTGSAGGRYITTDYNNTEESEVQFIGSGSAYYIKNPIYFGVSLDMAVDELTVINMTPKVGYTVNSADFNIGYQYAIEGTQENEVSFNATFTF